MAGSSNFLPFNSNKGNMMDDATYAASTYRTGGIPATPGAAPSNIHNKLFYQATMMAAALAQSLADKGYTVSDAVFADLVTVLNSLANSGGFAMTGAINEAQGTDIASASTCNIGAATGNYVRITGTTTITRFGTVQAGTRRIVRFAGALTLTHNATYLILPGGANIVTAAGDCAVFVSEGGNVWRCVVYQRANGTALVAPAPYTLPVATATVLGGVKKGTNITIAADGTISAVNGFTIGTGFVAHGNAVPLPSGCTSHLGIIVSMAYNNPSNYTWDMQQDLSQAHIRLVCEVSQSTRVVTVGEYVWDVDLDPDAYEWHPGTANYLIVGVA